MYIQRLAACLLLSVVPLRGARAEAGLAPKQTCQLKLASGKSGKGFAKLARDIDAVCGQRLALCEVETSGGLENLTALSANKADIAFVQVDILFDMKASDENIAALQGVLPANASLLHVVALKTGFVTRGERSLRTLFQSETTTTPLVQFSDLKGLPVALVGSAQLFGRTLDAKLGLGLKFVDVGTDEGALAALRDGEVAAVFSISGWPSGTLDKLMNDGSITLLPYNLPVQAPRVLVRKNYPNLGVFNVPFLAVPSLLVTRPFDPSGARGKAVSLLRRCILEQLPALQEGGFDPGWKEIKNPAETYGWPRFSDAIEQSVEARTRLSR